MVYDFDKIINRRGTYSGKYDAISKRGMNENTIPMWVADMDFASPECVNEAIRERSEHGVYGYSDCGEDYFSAVSGWYKRRYGWGIEHDWLVRISGVVFALHIIIEALSEPGDAVLVQQPVYMPFFHAVENRARKLAVNRLLYKDGRYEMDFEDFEQQIINNNVKLFILCNPHNPISRVWTREELTILGEICLKHGVIVISDEIHSDFVYPGYEHNIFASLSHGFAENSVTCSAPSKTFNLAGLQTSNMFVPNKELKDKITKTMSGMGIGAPNVIGQIACMAAYNKGDEWLDQLLKYLAGNIECVKKALSGIEEINVTEAQATYLLWLDCSCMGFTDDGLSEFFINDARLFTQSGVLFGAGGEGFQRVNIGAPRSVIEEAMGRLTDAINRR